MDLKHLCKPWKCCRCSRTHEEWFEIDDAEAMKVVDRWVKWVNQLRPYKKNELEPIWKYLMDYGRVPLERLRNNDHDARWAHWQWVLSPPSSGDFEGPRRHGDDNKQGDIDQQRHDTNGNKERSDDKRAFKRGQATNLKRLKDVGQANPASVGFESRGGGLKMNSITINANMTLVGNKFQGRASISKLQQG